MSTGVKATDFSNEQINKFPTVATRCHPTKSYFCLDLFSTLFVHYFALTLYLFQHTLHQLSLHTCCYTAKMASGQGALPGPSSANKRPAPWAPGSAEFEADLPRLLRRKTHRVRMPQRANPPPPPSAPWTFPQHVAAHWAMPGEKFNIFEGFLRHPHLLFELVKRLSPESFIDLFSMSKEFHWRVAGNMITNMQDYAKYHSPIAAYYSSWRAYPSLCVKDPTLRAHPDRFHLPRDVPSFRWAQMVVYRDKTVRRILTCLALDGHKLPEGAYETLLKYWLLMELPTQKRRQWFLDQKHVWTDKDLIIFMMFKVKLDMRFNDPIVGCGFSRLSRLILTQKSLSFLDQLLCGRRIFTCLDDIKDLVIRTYQTDDLNEDFHPDLGNPFENNVHPSQWGLLTRENFSSHEPVMMSPVRLLMMQIQKRKMKIRRMLPDFITYGYVAPGGKNVARPEIEDRGANGRKVVFEPDKSTPGAQEVLNMEASMNRRVRAKLRKYAGYTVFEDLVESGLFPMDQNPRRRYVDPLGSFRGMSIAWLNSQRGQCSSPDFQGPENLRVVLKISC